MHRFLLPSCVGVVLGVVWRSATDFGIAFIGCISVMTFAVLLFALRKQQRIYVSLVVILLCFMVGAIRMHVAIPVSPSLVHSEEVSFLGVVIQEPDVRDSYTNIVIAVVDTDEHVLVRTDRYTDVLYNDTIHVVGTAYPVENFETENNRVFNYRGYLAKDAIYRIVSFPEVTIVKHEASLVGGLLRVKSFYIDTLQKQLVEPYAALAAGITVGARRSLGDSLTAAFRDTGLIHIVVLSGYNITLIILFVSALLSFLPPRARFVGALVSIVAFTILVGASATVVRAALMGSIAALGTLTRRVYDATHALLVSALLMVMWNPYIVLYDPSFQLSFIATIGLLIGVPLLNAHLLFIPSTFHMREIVAATITTQIAVLPLLAYLVGEVSLVALLVNTLVLPVIPVAMLASFLVGVFSFMPIVHVIFTLATSALLSYVIAVVEFFASLPIVTMKLPEFSLGVLLVVYVLLSLLVTLWHRKSVSLPRPS